MSGYYNRERTLCCDHCRPCVAVSVQGGGFQPGAAGLFWRVAIRDGQALEQGLLEASFNTFVVIGRRNSWIRVVRLQCVATIQRFLNVLRTTHSWVLWTPRGPRRKHRIKKILIVWVTFGRKLLRSISKSEIYFFSRASMRCKQAGDVENTQFRFGSPRRDPFFDPSRPLPESRPILREPLSHCVAFAAAAVRIDLPLANLLVTNLH